MEEYRWAVRAPILGLPGPLQPSVAACGGLWTRLQNLQEKLTGERPIRPGDACDPPGPLLMGAQPRQLCERRHLYARAELSTRDSETGRSSPLIT